MCQFSLSAVRAERTERYRWGNFHRSQCKYILFGRDLHWKRQTAPNTEQLSEIKIKVSGLEKYLNQVSA